MKGREIRNKNSNSLCTILNDVGVDWRFSRSFANISYESSESCINTGVGGV